MEDTKSIGIWIRVSTEMQVKDDSPEVHEKRARMYAESKGWNIAHIYKLEAVSGKSVMEHPEAKRMLADVRKGLITGLIFSKLARLARNTKELLEFSEIFRQHEADLISLSESIDTSSSAGRLFYTMIAALSEWERSEIADRVKASVPVRARLGRRIGGQPPYGYKWEGDTFMIDEKEAPVRKLLHELFLKYKRMVTVAKHLNDLGYRTRSGAKWSDTTISRLLQDTAAKGIRRANHTYNDSPTRNWKMKPENEWIFLECPPILSTELWDASNALYFSQRIPHAKPTKIVSHLFTGILFCECGSKMHVPSKSKKYKCKACEKSQIETQDLEEIYYENLKSFLLTDAHLNDFQSLADGKIADKEKELDILQSEHKKVHAEMDKIMSLHLQGEIPAVGFRKYYTPLDEQRQQLEDSIPRIMGEIDFLKTESIHSGEVLDEARDLYSRWKSLTQEEKRDIVEQITTKITMDSESINIKFSYNPQYFRNPPDSQRMD